MSQLPINKSGPAKGRVNKSVLLFQIIQEEAKAGRPCDRQKAILIGRKRLEGCSKEIRPVGDFQTKDWYNAVNRSLGKTTHSAPPTQFKDLLPPPKEESRPADVITAYTSGELLAAKHYLSECGRSLVKARALLDLIATLTQEDAS